jgi:hypothetical protein
VRRALLRAGGLCLCGEKLVHFTSHTAKNPDRDFWRCTHWQKANDCGFFLWDDDEVLVLERKLQERDKKIEYLKAELEGLKSDFGTMRNKNAELCSELKKKKKNMVFVVCLMVLVVILEIVMAEM